MILSCTRLVCIGDSPHESAQLHNSVIGHSEKIKQAIHASGNSESVTVIGTFQSKISSFQAQ